MVVTSKDILSGFEELGVRSGDNIIVHSSFSSFGFVEGGERALLDSLKQLVGETGHIVMPTFTYRYNLFSKDAVSCVGKVTEYFRKDKDVLRSLHPTHSIAAYGEKKEDIIRNHFDLKPFDIQGPWKTMLDMNAKVVLIGVDNSKNSFIHFVERYCDVPYKRTVNASYINERNEICHTIVDEYPGDSYGFSKLNQLFIDKGITKEGHIGSSRIWVTETQDIVTLLYDKIKHQKDYLLCDRPECELCTNARKGIWKG